MLVYRVIKKELGGFKNILLLKLLYINMQFVLEDIFKKLVLVSPSLEEIGVHGSCCFCHWVDNGIDVFCGT